MNHVFLVIFVLSILVALAVGHSWGALSKQKEFNERPWLMCPHEFCEYHLPYRPLRNKKGDYVPETCGGCAGHVLYMEGTGYSSGHYIRFSP